MSAGFLVRRLIGIIVTVLGVSLVPYVILTWAPGDAAEALLGESASAEQVTELRQELGLDRPLLQRYIVYMGGAVRGDLGRSLLSNRPVGALILERLPNTILLALTAILLAGVSGVTLGLIAAARPRSALDLLISSLAVALQALPSYWVALVLVLVFAISLGWLPVLGAGTPAHLVLPALTLALPSIALVTRLVRSSAIEVTRSDYARTARAKGLSEAAVIIRHVLPNCIIPALTIIGLNLSHLIGGAFVIETVFAWPGLGRMTVQAIFDRDIPVLMGAVLTIAPLSLGANLLVDLLHGLLDPRIRSRAL